MELNNINPSIPSSEVKRLVLEKTIDYVKPPNDIPTHDYKRQLPIYPLVQEQLDESTANLLLSTNFNGYKIVALTPLGAGNALVFKVQDSNGNIAAIKLIPPGQLIQRNIERFDQEASIIQKLNHPNILHTFSFGVENNIHYLVMELAESTLRDYMDNETPEEKKSIRESDLINSIKILCNTCSGLHHLHSIGIIHRDVKPSNIFIVGENSKIGDLGLMRVTSDFQEAHHRSLTATGEVLGTVLYMAPEQADNPKVNRLADLYSIGAILYELLTGRAPFIGPTITNILEQHKTSPVINPGELNSKAPKKLVDISLKLLEKNPRQRGLYFDTALKVSEELKVFITGQNRFILSH